MKKLTRKLTLSLVAVLFAMLALGTSTFAWFSMNTTVTASDIEVTAVTPKNLLIHDGKLAEGTSLKAADTKTTWFNSISFKEQNIQSAALYPASTQDGKTFNGITDGNYIGSTGQGDVADENTTKFLPTASCGQAKTNNDGYYVVYEMYLKLSEKPKDGAQQVYVSKLSIQDVVVNSSATKLSKAARVAVFYENVGDLETAAAAKDGYADAKLLGIYSINGDATSACIIGSTAEVTTIASSSTLSKGEYAEAITVSSTGEFADTTATFDIENEVVKVTLVIWYEGEDANCINVNAGATIKAGIEFSLVK